MKSKKPFFSKEIIGNNLKRFWWVGVLYTIALFLVSPLVTLTQGSDTIPNIGYNINFPTIFEGTLIFLFTVPVFVGTMMFRYMQNSKSMVTIHAMPYNRLRLYVNNIISGLILLVIPLLLNAAFLSVIQLGNFGGTYFKEGIIIKALNISLLTSISLYIWTVFVGMFTGSSIAQIVFTYILNFLLAGIVAVSQVLLQGQLYGFVENLDKCDKFLEISPIAQNIFLQHSTPSTDIGHFLIIDLIICGIMLVLGYFVYKFRNLESAGEVISEKYVKPIFKYGVTICTMLVGTLYINLIFGFDKANIFIYIIFALLGYIISEMLLKKSFKIWKSYKGFLGFLIVLIVANLAISFDIFGYEKYVPNIDEIECVSFGDIDFEKTTIDNPGFGIMYESENIKNFVDLHKEIIKDKEINLSEKNYVEYLRMSYKLKNGKIIKRAYNYEARKYKENLEKIYDSKEYRRGTNDIFDYTSNDIYGMRIYNSVLNDGENFIQISSKEEIDILLNAMKEDILNTSTKERNEYTDVYSIEITLKPDSLNKNIHINSNGIEETEADSAKIWEMRFNFNYKKVNEYMIAKGYDKKLLTTENVASIFIKDKTITEREEIDKVINYIYKSSQVSFYMDDSTRAFDVKITLKNGEENWITVMLEDKK